MEARRLRLYVVAYLRGLLKPYYDRGVQSVIRENLVLKAIDQDLNREIMNHSALVDASLLSGAKNRSGLYGSIYDKLRDSRNMSEFKPQSEYTSSPQSSDEESVPKGKLTKGRKNLVDTYELLHTTGMWSDIEALFKSPKVKKSTDG